MNILKIGGVLLHHKVRGQAPNLRGKTTLFVFIGGIILMITHFYKSLLLFHPLIFLPQVIDYSYSNV